MAEKEDDCTLIYIGSLSNYDRNIDLLLDVFEKSMSARDNIKCVLGGKTDVEAIKSKIGSLKQKYPDRFSYLGYCSHDTVIQKTIESDIGFLFFRDFPNTRYSSPNKLYEYLLAGVAFIGVGKFVLEKEIVKNSAGFIFDFETDCNIILEKVLLLADDVSLKKNIKNNALTLGGNYTWETVESQYLKIYHDIQ